MLTVFGCIASEHDPRLVVLAGAVCIVACWTALRLLPCAESGRQVRGAWLVGMGFAFGSGIWATHFIAELAFKSSLPVGFAPVLTAISLILAIAGSVGGFALVLWRPGAVAAGVGGAVIGLTIAAMHFTGMMALHFPGRLSWNPLFVAVAVVIGVACSTVAMPLVRLLPGLAGRVAGAVLLMLSIVGLHFTAMAAVTLSPMAIAVPRHLLSGQLIAVIVAAAVLPILLLGITGAVFDERRARRSLAEAQRLRRFADATFEGILFHRNGVVTDVNAALCRLHGGAAEAMTGLHVNDLLPALADMRTPWSTQPFETGLRTGTGDVRPVEVLLQPIDPDGGDLAVVVVRDLSERKAQEKRIQYLAHHDPLTRLPNRVLLHDRLSQALAMAERSGNKVALLYLDLDNFKRVNDVLGHPVGDLLLVEVARRLTAEIREMDTAGRLGGDEFAIVQPLADQPHSAAALARRLVDRLGTPFDLAGHQVMVGTSVGVALFPDDAHSADILLKHADLALFRAKQEGRGTFCCFEPEMDQRLQRRRLLEQELRSALGRGQLEVHYQQFCDTSSLVVTGYEALLRWNHPVRGSISPAEFIPLAEESGLIIPLGRWVLEQACAAASHWPKRCTVSVNISPAQFVQQDLVAMVGEILRDSGLAPNRLELEVTEGILISNTERALQVLRGIKALGVRIALDDFGTGYSSLGYLRRFPFDSIKIDRSFVNGLCSDPESSMIVHSILALCRNLDLRVTAEGVETKEQLAKLCEYGCDVVQGYLLGGPVALTHSDAAPSDDPRRQHQGRLTPAVVPAIDGDDTNSIRCIAASGGDPL